MIILNYWQTNVIGYLASMVVFSHHYKMAVKDSNNEYASTILLQLIGAVSILLLTPFSEIKVSTAPISYILLILASIFFAINNRLQTSARRNLEISTYSVINQLSVVFLVILGIIFLNEIPSSIKFLALGLIVGGNCLIFIRSGILYINKYSIEAVLAGISAALGVFISVGLSKQFNLPLYIFLTFVTPALMIKTFKRIEFGDIVGIFERGYKMNYVLAGIAWGLAIYFSLRAMQLGEISQVVPLQSLTVLINVLSGYFYMQERNFVYRKLVAAAMIIVGVYINIL